MGDIPPFTPDDEEGFDFLDEDATMVEGETQPPEGDNRSFLYAVGALVAFMLVMLLAFGAYAMLVLPKQRAARQTEAASINAQNTQIAQAITQTAEAMLWTATPSPTPPLTPTPSPTPAPTNTPVIVPQPVVTVAATPTVDTFSLGATATAVYLTQVAAPRVTPTATQLPITGVGDHLPFPTLAVTALVLLALILIARRLRMARQ